MLIFSGISPGTSGVGRLMSTMCTQAARRQRTDIEIICRPQGPSWLRHLRKGRINLARNVLRDGKAERMRWEAYANDERVLDSQSVVLIHPQTLGLQWCQKLIQARRHPTWIYLMDAGFFCARSYNHIPGEHASCLRCLRGEWTNAETYDCVTQGPMESLSGDFLDALRQWVAEGRVKCAAQNARQAELAFQHFGNHAQIEIVGLWVADWDEVFSNTTKPLSSNVPYDVVFHGMPLAAKGFIWAIKLARQCPNQSFLFPCSRRQAAKIITDVPPNITFRKMNWEHGLREAITSARIVLNTSLWSAPIEGALIKSIIEARAVAVADEASAYADELPDWLVLRLPCEIEQAAAKLRDAIHQWWCPNDIRKQEWIDRFRMNNFEILERLSVVCC